jgi:hypothetical protein
MADKVRNAVKELLAKLEEEGVGGVHAWFSGTPHILVRREADRRLYRVLMRRDGAIDDSYFDEFEKLGRRIIISGDVSPRGEICPRQPEGQGWFCY